MEDHVGAVLVGSVFDDAYDVGVVELFHDVGGVFELFTKGFFLSVFFF